MKNQTESNWLVNFYTWLRQLGCTHNHCAKERNKYSDGVTEHLLVCMNCGKEFPIPFALTQPSGVFERIDERLENQLKYAQLVQSAEQYQAEV